MAIVFGFKGAMTPSSSADEDVAESVGILLLLVLVFRVHTCCFLYKTQARGEKKMMKEEICSFFSHREREEAPPRTTFFTHELQHKQKKNEHVHPRVHRNAQSLQKSGRDHQRGGQGESAGTNFVHGRSRLGVLAHFPRLFFFCFLYRQKMVKA